MALPGQPPPKHPMVQYPCGQLLMQSALAPSAAQLLVVTHGEPTRPADPASTQDGQPASPPGPATQELLMHCVPAPKQAPEQQDSPDWPQD
jgi:hypothetical protein